MTAIRQSSRMIPSGLSSNRKLSRNVRSIAACWRLKHRLIVIGLRDEFGSPLFFGELIPNGGDTSDTGNLEKLAVRSNARNSG
jgi:hypothetical protein